MMYRSSIVAFMAFAAVAAFASNVTVWLYAIGDTKGASSLSPSSKTLTVDQDPSATLEQLSSVSRTGYTLDATQWKASRYSSQYDAGLVFDSSWCSQNAQIDVSNNKPRPEWKMLVVPVTPNPYTVVFNANGGSGTMNPQSFTYDEAKALALNSFTKVGHAFSGWNYGGHTYADGEVVSNLTTVAGREVTFTAVWSANTYTITLDAGEADTPGTASVQATYGSAFPSPITLPTRFGYRFKGYYTQEEGAGDPCYLANGNPCTSSLSSNATIYAWWEQIPVYNVTFLPLGGTFSNGWTASTNYTEGVGLTLPTKNDITRDNKDFGGWFEEDDIGFMNRIYSITSSDRGDKSYRARWLDKSYTVEFKSNGGSGSGTQDFSMGESQALKDVADMYIRRPGYSFKEWSRNADGSGDCYANGEIIDGNLTDVAGDVVVLYAQWTPNPYEVAFHPNGADGGETMDNQSFVYDVTQHLDAVEFTYTGRAFERWSSDTNYNYQTKYYADGAEVVNLTALSNDVVNLYANWTGIVYTVSFDANGGAGTMAPMPCTYDVPTNLPACVFTRDGWGFKNWTNAVGEVFVDRARATNLTATAGADVSLFACWTGVTYAVTLDASRDSRGIGLMTNDMGEAVSVFTTSAVVGDAWSLPVPTNVNENLTFAGWRYGDGQTASGEVPPPSSGSANLVAAWAWVTDDLAAAVDAPELGFRTFATWGDHGTPDEPEYTDPDYSTKWFAQTNFMYGSTNAVQSGRLPVNTEDGKLYVSWLTTTVDTNGVLSFWWKCDAQPLIEEQLQQETGGWAGDTFRFGLFDHDKGITNEVARLTNHVGWCQVVYTNKSDSAVSFAWAFVYADYGYANGGGTGWVDRVTWTPEGAAADVTPTHGVPYSWLRENLGASATATDEELEALAESASPNGKAWPDGTPVKVWEDYWAGTDPNDPNELFHALIAVTNGTPTITWRPDMREADPPRVYHVLCAPMPSARSEEWVEWPGPGTMGAATNRFFKVELDVEGSR